MSFSIVEANYYRDKAVQQLVTFPKNGSPSYTDATASTDIVITALSESKSLYFHNGGAAVTLTLPTEAELSTLFEQPETGAILAWNTYNDNASNITIETSEDATKKCVLSSLIGVFMLILEDYDPSTGVAVINVGYIPSSSSFPCPKPVARSVTANGVLHWSSFNMSSAYPQTVCLTGTTAGVTLTLGTGLELWKNMFGSLTSLSGTLVLYTNTVCIVNNTTQSVTISDTLAPEPEGVVTIDTTMEIDGGGGVPGAVVVSALQVGTFSLPQFAVAELAIKILSVTGNPPTAATAVANVTIRTYST